MIINSIYTPNKIAIKRKHITLKFGGKLYHFRGNKGTSIPSDFLRRILTSNFCDMRNFLCLLFSYG